MSSTTPLAPGCVDFRERPGPTQVAALFWEHVAEHFGCGRLRRGSRIAAQGRTVAEDSPANGTSARVSPADERLVSRVFRVFVSQPQKTLPRMSGHLPQSGIFLPSARRLSEFGRLAALV